MANETITPTAVQSASPKNKFSLQTAQSAVNRKGHSIMDGVIHYDSKTGSLKASAAADYLVKHHRFTLVFED